MKRTERHHIKEDGLASNVNKFLQFFKAREREFLLLGLAVLVVAVALVGISIVKSASAARQSRVVGEILTLRDTLGKDAAAVGKIEALSGRGKFGRVGWIELAAWEVEQNALDKADGYLAKVGRMPKDLLYYKAQMLQAQVDVLRKKFDPAIEIYTKIEAEKPASCPLDAVLFRHAQALELKNDRKGAAELYKKVQADYPSTGFAYEAAAKAARLGGA